MVSVDGMDENEEPSWRRKFQARKAVGFSTTQSFDVKIFMLLQPANSAINHLA
jgi:hypothetical protein